MANLNIDTSFTVHVDGQALVEAARSDGVVRQMMTYGRRVESRGKAYCPVDTGRLRASIRTAHEVTADGVVVTVGTNVKYSSYVHNGTGIYGPEHRPITPKTASVLRFKPKGSPKFVYAQSVKGMRARPFLKRALDDVFSR